MPCVLRVDGVWPVITAAARGRKGHVAVAYLGTGATKLLPLKSGSVLVVDASEAAVHSGRTDPRELEKFRAGDVSVFSVENLHAKVFVFGTVAFVGSTNASNHSAVQLLEAALETRESAAVRQAREFVLRHALEPLGPEHLKRLIRMYNPPKFPRGRAAPKHRTGVGPRYSPLRIVQLKRIGWTDAETNASEIGEPIARKERRPKFRLEQFSWSGSTPKKGEHVVQVTADEHGQNKMVSPPGRVIHRQPAAGGKRVIVFVEVPSRNRRALAAIRRRRGARVAKRLARGGVVTKDFGVQLRSFWGA